MKDIVLYIVTLYVVLVLVIVIFTAFKFQLKPKLGVALSAMCVGTHYSLQSYAHP